MNKSKLLLPLIFRQGASLMVIRICGVILTFIATALITRGLGAEGYGRYVFILGVVTLASVPTQIGLPDLIVRETAKAVAVSDHGKFRVLLRWAHVYLGASSALMIGLIISWWFLSNRPELSTLIFASLLIPLVSLGNIRGAALRGLGRGVLGQLPEYIVRPILLFMSIAFFAADRTEMTLQGVFLAQVFAAIIAFLVGLVIFKLIAKSYNGEAQSQPDKSYWRRSLIALSGISSLSVINSSADVVILGIWVNDMEVGQYRIAAMVAAFFTLGLQTMNNLSMSYMSTYLETNKKDELKNVVCRSSQFSLAFAAIGLLVAVLIQPTGLEAIFGTGFSASFPILLVLSFGHLTNAFFGPVISLLTMAGSERTVVLVSAFGTVANIGLNLALIPVFGAIGAAVASSVSVILVRVVLFRTASRTLGVRSWPLGWK